MKRNKMISVLTALVLTLTILAGCGEETGSTSSGQSGQTSQTGKTGQTLSPSDSGNPSVETNGTAGEPEQDYSWFEMPQETDTLVLYSAGLNTTTINHAVEIFKKLYPEVNVDWHRLGEDEFVTKIRAEIPAGKGPDLLYASGSDFSDVYKTMSTGVFEDLNPYIANDPDFHLDDYITGIMDAGLYRGSRYILPVSHRSQPYVTTEEALAEVGCTIDDIRTFSGFLDTANRYKEKYPENNAIVNYARAGYDASNLLMFFQCSGFRFIDYDAGEIILNEERFREMIDYCKSIHGGKTDQKETKTYEEVKLKKRDCLFLEGPGSPITIEQTWRKIQDFQETPVMITIPDISDGQTTLIQTIGAIPKGSSNKLNAWRFLKILLSEEIQSNANALIALFPVNKKAVRQYLIDGAYFTEKEMGVVDQAEEYLTNFDHAIFYSPLIYQYVRDSMMPYITGKDSYEKCLGKLLNTLELYKDE